MKQRQRGLLGWAAQRAQDWLAPESGPEQSNAQAMESAAAEQTGEGSGGWLDWLMGELYAPLLVAA